MRELDWAATPLGAPATWPQPLKTLVELMLAANQPMFLAWGPERTMLYNDGYARLLGPKHPAAMGRPFRDVWAEIWSELTPLVDRVWAGGSVHMDDIDFQIDRGHGLQEAHFAFSYTPVRTESGDVEGLFCACVETTDTVFAERERRAVLEALSASESNYRHAVDLSPQTIWTSGPDGLLDHVGTRWMEWTGTDGLGASWGDVMHPDDLQPSIDAWTRSLTTGAPYDIEHRARVRDGGYRWMHSRAYPRRDESGTIVRWYGTTEDIDQAHRAEQARRQTEARLGIVVDNATDYAIFTADPDRVITSWSAGAAEIFGWSAEEAIGRSADLIFTPEDRAAGQPEHEVGAALDEGCANDERWHMRKDGGRVFMNGSVRPLPPGPDGRRGVMKIARDETARRKTEDALRKSEARHRLRAELGDALRGLTAPSDIMAAINERLGPYLGVDQANYHLVEGDNFIVSEEWRSDRSAGLLGTHRIADFGPEARRLMDLKEVLRVDDTRGADGAEGYAAAGMVAVLSAPLHSGGRWAGGFHVHSAAPRVWTDEDAALVRDIAERAWAEIERARAEAELRESEARLRAVFDAAPIGLVFADANGRITGGNAQIERIVGHPILASANVDEYEAWVSFHADGRQVKGHEFPLARAVAGEEERPELEVLYRRGDGRMIWLRFVAAPIKDAEGRIVGGVVASLDVDAQRRAEADLKTLNANLEQQVAERTAERDRMWQLSSDVMLVARFDGVIEAVNPAWTAVLGWTEAELVGSSLFDFIHPDDLARTVDGAAGLSRGENLTRFDNRYRHKDGGYRDISWGAVAGDGLIIAVGRDVTDDKEQAAELAAAQDALRQAQKMEAVGQLTGGIAHDFNNLLTGIVGSLELLQRRVAEGRYDALEKYAGVAMTSAHRAAGLTQRLLAFSRRQPLDPKAVEANRLVASMEDLLRRTLGPQIDLEFVLAGGLWPTLCDPNQLESAILNLAINARDAMPEGGRLTVETANAHLDEAYARAQGDEVRPGQYVAISVTDTGTGIAPDVAERIFEPFFTTKPIGQGTGLGLSQLYGFVKQSGGHVALYSEPGQGTTFRLYLPRHRGPLGGEDEPEEAEAAKAAREGECVLVVEDEAAVRMLITETLEELGYGAIEAVDGPTGLKELESHKRIDLLVTDVGLPGLNGRQLADAARALRPDLKVLFITGFAGNAAVGNGLLEPGMEMMTKPFAMDQLAAKIRAMIEG